MNWIAYRATEGKNEDMTPVLRFKIRGVYNNKKYPELICLHGIERASDHFSIHVKSGSVSADHGDNDYKVYNWKSSTKTAKQEDKYYQSIIVSDQEWQEYQDKYGIAALPQDNDFHHSLRQICQTIEIETSRHGHELRHLQDFEIASDNNAIKGKLSINDDGDSIFPWRRRQIHGDNLFMAQEMFKDVWHVQTFPEKKHPIPPAYETLNFEFIMHNGNVLSEEEARRLPEEMNKKFSLDAPDNPDWKMTMINGIEVELMGICTNPSFGGDWWGPDGRPLDYQPFFGKESAGKTDENRTSYDAAFRIYWPKGTDESGTTIQVVTSNASAKLSKGTSGYHPEKSVIVLNLTAEKEVTEVDIKVEIGVQEQKKKTVIFRSIPLVPGKSDSFNITEDAAERETD
ncbi:MAG: hypothetical protein ACYSUT_03105, partial [Planctomycetota bacterium]|jgi:hypothetical protein